MALKLRLLSLITPKYSLLFWKAQYLNILLLVLIIVVPKDKVRIKESKNILIWKRPTRIIEPNFWLHIESPKIQALCPREL